MKKTKLIPFLIILLFNGCSTKNKEVESIEFMAYQLSCYNKVGEITNDHISCHTYSLIDKNGSATIFRHVYYPKTDSFYFKLSIDKKLITEIIAESKIQDTSRIKFDPDHVEIYDGPTFRIRINYTDKNFKSFAFVLPNTNEYYIKEHGKNTKNIPYLKLWHLLDSTFDSGKYDKTNDTIDFEKTRIDFINFTLKQDTTNPAYPRPPKPDRPKIKFISPK